TGSAVVSVKISASLLASDFARLADEVARAEEGGADWIHVDVMDGHFVPNITIGVPVVAAVREVTDLPLDVHLMIERPGDYVDAFADAGADGLTVHQEAAVHLHRTVEAIRHHGLRAGVSLNPGTPVSTLDEIAPYIDLVLVMTVNPGFGNQRFIPTSTAKVRSVAALLDAAGRTDVEIQVDGGIGPDTAGEVAAAGATVLVAGSAIYGGPGTVAENIAAIRSAAGAG
ncbi:MAG: ribulose-phosphate 3-epimerase, partial [Longimicrobiales bacterium]|nr:ribulose-phosphate 3-epimerase [Longimicrobiales bacterium]